MIIENTYVFCDVDGTLGIEGKGIPARNREAIKRFVDMGGHVALCTGRWVEAVRHFCSDLAINAPCVIGNGAGIYEFEKDRILYYQHLPIEAGDIIADVMARHPEFGLLGVSLESGYHYLGDASTNVRVFGRRLQYPNQAELDSSSYIKFHIGLPRDVHVSATVERLNLRYAPYLDRVRFVQTDEQYVEMLPAHANKGVGIKKIADLLQVDLRDTVFIGNHFNDFEAFQVAGLSACVASTPNALRFIPKYQLGETMDGAVADMLNMLMRKARIDEMQNIKAVS